MSYSRFYTVSVPYSGTVSYPASESGGSKSYSGSVPVDITIEVDTDDFDASVDRCKGHVNGLTAAVAATEAAEVEAKKLSSRKIAQSILKGFFNYVGADLSQKIKELHSSVESLFFALVGHRENCLSKRGQMQDDYNRISKRYGKLFDDLDKETVSRIEQLDRPVFLFAESARGVVDRNSNTDLLGLSTVSANENLRLETVLACSHVKQQAGTLLNKAEEYLMGSYILTHSVQHMLEDGLDASDILLPMLFVETAAGDGTLQSRVYGTEGTFVPHDEKAEQIILSDFLSKDRTWEDLPDEDLSRILAYINAKIQSDNLEERTLKTMLDLMNGPAIRIIKA